MTSCFQRSAAYSINLAADGSIEPIANYPEQPQPRFPDQELPILRRAPRSNASSVAARGSGQVRLSMMSSVSSQLGAAGHQQLPAISSAADAEVHQQAVVEPRSESSVNPAEQIELERVEQTELLAAGGN